MLIHGAKLLYDLRYSLRCSECSLSSNVKETENGKKNKQQCRDKRGEKTQTDEQDERFLLLMEK